MEKRCFIALPCLARSFQVLRGPEDSPGSKQKSLCQSVEFPADDLSSRAAGPGKELFCHGSAARGSPPVAVSHNCLPCIRDFPTRDPKDYLSSYPEFFLQLCHIEEQPCGSAMIYERVLNQGVECECRALLF